MSVADVQKIVKGSGYAALLLHDCGQPITAAAITAIFKTIKVEGFQPTFQVVENFLKNTPITNFISSVGGSAPAAAAPAAATAAKKEEPKKEEARKLHI